MEFYSRDLGTIQSALRIAADVYTQDAATMRREAEHHSAPAQFLRLADQFEQQARDARKIADVIDGGN